jgi:hypothetical protein
LNSAVFFFPPQPIQAFGTSFTYPNLLVVVWIVGHVSVFLVVMIAEARRLAAVEPPRVMASSVRLRSEHRGTIRASTPQNAHTGDPIADDR